MSTHLEFGRHEPMGAHARDGGVNFAVFSEHAEAIELCLFDGEGNETHVELPEMAGYCHHGYLLGIRPGQRYGYRVHGPWEPEKGLRCNASKLLLDPYAKAVDGSVQWNDAVFAYQIGAPEGPPNREDSAPVRPKSGVDDP